MKIGIMLRSLDEQGGVGVYTRYITENLLASGLTYVPGTTSFDTDNVATPPVVEPAVSGPNGSVLTWTLSNAFVMDTRSNGAGSTPTSAARTWATTWPTSWST